MKGEDRGLGDSRRRISVSTADRKVTVEKGILILRNEECTVLLARCSKVRGAFQVEGTALSTLAELEKDRSGSGI